MRKRSGRNRVRKSCAAMLVLAGLAAAVFTACSDPSEGLQVSGAAFGEQKETDAGSRFRDGVAEPVGSGSQASSRETADSTDTKPAGPETVEEPLSADASVDSGKGKEETENKGAGSFEKTKPGNDHAEVKEKIRQEEEAAGSRKPSGEASDRKEKTDQSIPKKTTGGSQTAHTHEWKPVYKNVHHDAVTHTEDRGHYETVTVQEAWDEPVYDSRNICNQCGADITGNTGDHYIGNDACENYSLRQVQTGTVHHDAVTEERWIPDIVTVTDKEARDEQIISGYRCSICGTER